MDLAIFFEYLFMGLLGAAMIGIVSVAAVVLRRLFKGQA